MKINYLNIVFGKQTELRLHPVPIQGDGHLIVLSTYSRWPESESPGKFWIGIKHDSMT